MKKTLSIILAIASLVVLLMNCAVAEENESSWPVWTLNRIETSLKKLPSEEDRHQGYFGPAKSYPGAGAYKPYKVNKLTALFREGDFVLVDMDYQTAGKRCVYFKASALQTNDVDTTTLVSVPAITTTLLIPKYGPGIDYENVEQTKESKYANWSLMELAGKFGGSAEIYAATQPTKYTVYLEEGTDVNVFFETEGWIFAEFDCDMGTIRAWLPAEYVAVENE